MNKNCHKINKKVTIALINLNPTHREILNHKTQDKKFVVAIPFFLQHQQNIPNPALFYSAFVSNESLDK